MLTKIKDNIGLIATAIALMGTIGTGLSTAADIVNTLQGIDDRMNNISFYRPHQQIACTTLATIYPIPTTALYQMPVKLRQHSRFRLKIDIPVLTTGTCDYGMEPHRVLKHFRYTRPSPCKINRHRFVLLCVPSVKFTVRKRNQHTKVCHRYGAHLPRAATAAGSWRQVSYH